MEEEKRKEKKEEPKKIYVYLIGFFSGMLLITILIWILFETRSFIFSVCSSNTKGCISSDYYNDPGESLAHNSNLKSQDILFLANNGKLYYNRTLKNNKCFPEDNRVVEIIYPQYCEFFDKKKRSLGLWKQTSFNSNIYVNNNYDDKITTSGDCNPLDSEIASYGKISLKWDKNPFI